MILLKKLNCLCFIPLLTPLQPIEHHVSRTVFIFAADSLALSNRLFGWYPAMDLRTLSSISTASTSHFEGNPITYNELNDGVGIGILDGNINRLCKEGKLKEAVDMLHTYDQQGIGGMLNVGDWSLHATCLTKCVIETPLLGIP